MKVSMWYNNGDIRLEETPTPEPDAHEILAKVIACGVCGSDVVEWYRLPRAPLVQGHEIGAEIVTVGGLVKGYAPGDRIFVAPKIPCMECATCKAGHHPQCTQVTGRLPGGFAEYVLIPKDLVEKGIYRLPDSVSFEAATFIEPLACVLRAQRLADLRSGQTVMVLGSGMSGILNIRAAKSNGCRVIATDVSKTRLKYALESGADVVLDASEGISEKAEVVIVTTSALPALEQAWKAVMPGGAVVLFAVPGPDKTVTVPVNDFWRQEIRILTSYYCGPDDLERSLSLIENGTIAVEDLVTHRFPLEKAGLAFRLMLASDDSMKILIRP